MTHVAVHPLHEEALPWGSDHNGKGRAWLADSGANNTPQPQAKATLGDGLYTQSAQVQLFGSFSAYRLRLAGKADAIRRELAVDKSCHLRESWAYASGHVIEIGDYSPSQLRPRILLHQTLAYLFVLPLQVHPAWSFHPVP